MIPAQDIDQVMVQLHEVLNNSGVSTLHEAVGIVELFKNNLVMQHINPMAFAKSLQDNMGDNLE